MPLNDIAIRSLQPDKRLYRKYDGDKLYLLVFPNGVKAWRVRIYRDTKETMLSLGNYPAVSLKQARMERDKINMLLASGVDPVTERKRKVKAAIGEGITFQEVYDQWLTEHVPPVWSESHYEKQVIRINKHLIPPLGSMAIADIAPATILALVKGIEKQGLNDTAHRIMGISSQIMRYAVANGWIPSDPCRDLTGALAPVVVTHYAAVTEPLAIGRLLLDIDAYTGTGIVKCALRLAPLVFVRPTELRKAEWSEFDFQAEEWRIPASRMKMRDQHIVPLCRQAMGIVKELYEMTGTGRFVFPSIRAKTQYMSNGTILSALRRMGYSGEEMTGHGFRTLASTTMNEKGKNADHIEKQLAHAPRDQVRAAYNRASYLHERKEMMTWWGDYLDELRARRIEYEKNTRSGLIY